MNKIRIKGNTEEDFKSNLESALNIAFVVCTRGFIPSSRDIVSPRERGKYWWIEEISPDKRYVLGNSNDHWAYIKDEGENYIVLEIRSRNTSISGGPSHLAQTIASYCHGVELVGEEEPA